MSDHDRLSMIEDMLKQNPKDSFLQYAAALEYEKIADHPRAIERITVLLEQDPDYLGAYYKLGKLYEATGNETRAIEVYKQGRALASQKKDPKTLGELTEALMLLDADDDIW